VEVAWTLIETTNGSDSSTIPDRSAGRGVSLRVGGVQVEIIGEAEMVAEGVMRVGVGVGVGVAVLRCGEGVWRKQ
jgi:hypothetical protein